MTIPTIDLPFTRRHLVQTAGGLALGLAGTGFRSRLAGPALAFAQTPVATAGDELTTAAIDAWLYGYPLLLMDITRELNTNVAAPGGSQAPINQLVNLRAFPDASFTTVVAPNVDTLYSITLFDLMAGPLVLQWPDMGERYFQFPIFNGWTDVVTSPGSRTTGQGAGTLVIAGPDWDGTTPAGIDLPTDTIGVRVSTNLAWLIGRIYCAGTPEDYAAVHAIQDQLTLVPLSAWGTDYTAPAGTVDPAIDMTTAPVDQVNALPAADYFPALVSLLDTNPPYPADAPLLSRLATLGIAPGVDFDLSTLDPAVQQALQDAPQAGLALLRAEGPKTLKTENGWSQMVGAAEFGTDYRFRAYVSLTAFGANLNADTVYPIALTDSTGETLTGANQYVAHFDSDPPVNAFWSLTAYTDQGFLIDNPLDRYAIRGNDPLVKASDGSFDLYLQAASPGADKEANWLPTGSDQFKVYLRCYWPEEALIDGAWPLPKITKAG